MTIKEFKTWFCIWVLLAVTFLIALLFTLSTCGHAQELDKYAEWGAGFLNDTQTDYSQVKFVEAGVRGEYTRNMDFQIGGGGWTDGSHYPGASDSLYGTALLGVGPKLGVAHLEYFFGGAYILTPDTVLGSNLQFAHELLLGIYDSRKVGMYVCIKHFSNAGVVRPNYGRNFAGVGVSFE